MPHPIRTIAARAVSASPIARREHTHAPREAIRRASASNPMLPRNVPPTATTERRRRPTAPAQLHWFNEFQVASWPPLQTILPPADAAEHDQPMNQAELRRAVVETARAMGPAGINQGASGNVSARCADGLLVTPSGLPYDRMTPDDVVHLDAAGSPTARPGLRPSSEWRMHRDILAARPDLGAVVHAHPPFCVVIGIMRPRIPPIHYMVAMAGGADVRVAPYAPFGTAELSALAVAALDGRRACLLAHHGLVAAGPDLPAALALAVEVEALARQYHGCLQIAAGAEPPLLTERQVAEALDQFATGYGAIALAPGHAAG